MFKANGRAPSRESAMPARQQTRPSHNNGPPQTGVHQHVKRHRGIEPRPYKQTDIDKLTKTNKTTVRQQD